MSYIRACSVRTPETACTFSGSCAGSAPITLHAPAVGASIPFRSLTVVVFPAPFGPRNPNTSPCSRERLISFTASFPPEYVLLKSCSVTVCIFCFLLPDTCMILLLYPIYSFFISPGSLLWIIIMFLSRSASAVPRYCGTAVRLTEIEIPDYLQLPASYCAG